MPRILPIILCVNLLALASCRSVQPASPSVAAPREPAATTETTESAPATASKTWPERWGGNDDTRGVVVDLEHPVAALGVAHLSRNHQLRISELEYTDADALAAAVGAQRPPKFRAEGPGSYVFAPRRVDNEDLDLSEEPALAFRYVSAQLVKSAPQGAGDPEDHVELERTWFTYNPPIKDDADTKLLVLLPGMFGTPEPIVDATQRYFRMKGWSVLRMLAPPSRFTAYTRYVIPENPVALSLTGAAIAQDYDNRTAEAAYAVDAALDHVTEHDAALAGASVCILGMSGGAMATPTVHALDPDRFKSAVLIAGGGNFLEISARSNYSKWIDAIELDADGSEDGVQPLSGEQLASLSTEYLEYTKLDALKTAATLRGKPVLMLHASSDKAVPASSGDALHAALGEPERWTYPMGHELIFAALPTQIPKIETWAREHTLD